MPQRSQSSPRKFTEIHICILLRLVFLSVPSVCSVASFFYSFSTTKDTKQIKFSLRHRYRSRSFAPIKIQRRTSLNLQLA